MPTPTKQLITDGILLTVSIIVAIVIVQTGIAHEMISALDGVKWLAIICSGMLFTSALTTPPAVILLSQFAETTPLPTLALLGGFGAMLGDYVLFRFVKDRMAEDVNYLLSFSKRERFHKIFETRVFRIFAPLIAIIIIAAPLLPDEIGVAMLGFAKIKTRFFFLVSFVANSLGVLIIGLIARALL